MDVTTKQPYHTYKRRWLILLSFSLGNFANSLNWISFSPISSYTSAHYSISNFDVNVLSLVFLIAPIPLFFPTGFLLDNYGLKHAIIPCCILQLLGSWLRFFGGDSYGVLLTGQILCAIASVSFMVSSPKISAFWFAEDERTIATSISSLSNPIGIAAGLTVPSLLVSSPKDLPYLLLIEAIITTVCSLFPALLFIKDKPPTPPSESSFSYRENFWHGTKQAWKKPSFVIICFAFGIGFGTFNVLSTLLDQVVRPLGYGDEDISLFGGLLILLGLIGAGIASAIVDKTREYKKALLFCFIGVVASIIWFCACLKPGQADVLAAAFASIGFFGMAVLPLSLETCFELVYPVGEGVTSGSMMLVGQVLGTVFLLVAQAVTDGTNYTNACWGGVGLTLISLLLVSCIKPVYLRLQAEKEAASPNSQSGQELIVV